MTTTAGTNTAEILSASWPISGLLLCAPAHHADNSCQRGLAADGAGGKQHAAILHHGPGVNGVAIAFCCGTGSPVSIASSNRGFALAYHAVDRDAVAGSQAQRHAGLNFRERQIFLALGRDDPRRRRRQVEQFFQRFSRER